MSLGKKNAKNNKNPRKIKIGEKQKVNRPCAWRPDGVGVRQDRKKNQMRAKK